MDWNRRNLERNAIVGSSISVVIVFSVLLPWVLLNRNGPYGPGYRVNALSEILIGAAPSWWPSPDVRSSGRSSLLSPGAALIAIAVVPIAVSIVAWLVDREFIRRYLPLVFVAAGALSAGLTCTILNGLSGLARQTSPMYGLWLALISSIGLASFGVFSFLNEQRHLARARRQVALDPHQRSTKGMSKARLESANRAWVGGMSVDSRGIAHQVSDGGSLTPPVGQSPSLTATPSHRGEAAPRKWSSAYVWANLTLLALLALSLLLPMFRLGAFGVSVTANAFRSAGGSGDGEVVRFWLTGVAVGWIVLALVVAAAGVLVWTTQVSKSSLERIGVYLFALSGALVAGLLVATWWYASRSVGEAAAKGVKELKAEGNPFAGLGSLVDLSPVFGFWISLMLALASVGFGLSAIWLEKPPRSIAGGLVAGAGLSNGSQSAAKERVALLKDLTALRDQGVLSEAEFENQKRQILAAGGDEATEID